MKKNSMRVIIAFLLMACFPLITNAELACDNTIYNVDHVDGGKSAILPGSNGYPVYPITLYNTTSGGNAIKTYCIDPLARSPLGANECVRRIDPSNASNDKTRQAYDVSVTVAYQLLSNKGHNSNSDEDRAMGEVIFRWIGNAFGQFEVGINSGLAFDPKNGYRYNGNGSYFISKKMITGMYANPNGNSYWSAGTQVSNGTTYQEWIDIFNQAIAAGNSILSAGDSKEAREAAYKSLVSSGTMWEDQYTSKIVSTKQINDTVSAVEIDVTVNGDVDYIYWPQFGIDCGNRTVKCSLASAKGDNKSGKLVVQVEKTTGYDNQPFDIYFTSQIYDKRSASANMIIVRNPSKTTPQKMLLVADPTTGQPNLPRGGSTHRVDENCTCEYDSNGKWTGKYLLNKFKNGVLVGTEKIEPGPEATSNGCPASCEKPATCEKKDDKFYCKDGKECDEKKFKEECSHTCQTPSQSGDGHYYGPESSPGKGDGKDLGTDDNARLEYERLCENKVNCSPTVSIPGTCADFNYGNKESFNASISDINLNENSSCNPDANQVKACVLGAKDAAQNKYESSVDGIEGNRYCKVYCKENYDFNLPSARLTTSGEYFTLTTAIKGNRDCYVSSATDSSKGIAINKDGSNQFHKDMEAVQERIINAWNGYMKGKAGVEAWEPPSTTYNGSIAERVPNPNDHGYTCQNWTECPQVKIVRYEFSYQQLSISGRSNGTVSTSSYTDTFSATFGTKPNYGCGGSCGKDGMPEAREQYNEFVRLRDESLREMTSAVNELNKLIGEYNSCSGAIQNTNQSNIGNVNPTSSGWANEMKYGPIVTFEYNQDYLEKKEGNFNPISGTKKDKNEESYCTGEVDDKYNCPSGFQTTTAKNTVTATSQKAFTICGSGDFGCKQVNYTISDARWVKKSREISEEYEPNRTFSTLSPYGTVKIGKDGRSTLYTNLPDHAFPISLVTQTGTFPFKFTFKNIGQSNQDGSLGRLIGDSRSILTAFNNLSPSMKCSGTEEDKVSPDKVTSTVDGGYVCHYINNCPDCTGKCDPEGNCEMCLPNDPSCNNPCTDHCVGYCKNCVFGGTSAGYTFRTVTVNNLQPNPVANEYQAWNWNNEYKGQITKKEIESAGESIYEKPQFSIRLEISDLANLRKYNDDASSFINEKLPEGMTNNNGEDSALYCQKITLNGKEYLVRCRSTFLDIIEERKGYGTILERVTRDDDGFELFTDDSVEEITGCGKSSGYACLNERGIGPSWRVKGSGDNR